MGVSHSRIVLQTPRIFWLAPALAVAILAFAPQAFAEPVYDLTAQDYAAAVPEQPAPDASTQQTLSYRVLWDTSHGVYRGYYQPSGTFQPLVQNLASHGFTVDTTTEGFLVDEPAGYHVIVVCIGSAWYGAYSPVEVTLITEFVQNGGGLLILADNLNTPNHNIQPVASVFGVDLGLSMVRPYDTYTGYLAQHPVFDGVQQIYMRAAGEISASGPSTEIAWQEGTLVPLAALAEYGAGRVVTLGDTTFDGQPQADNSTFAVNTFEYLAVPEPAAFLMLALSALCLRKRPRP
jgi:hypothetical protein